MPSRISLDAARQARGVEMIRSRECYNEAQAIANVLTLSGERQKRSTDTRLSRL